MEDDVAMEQTDTSNAIDTHSSAQAVVSLSSNAHHNASEETVASDPTSRPLDHVDGLPEGKTGAINTCTDRVLPLSNPNMTLDAGSSLEPANVDHANEHSERDGQAPIQSSGYWGEISLLNIIDQYMHTYYPFYVYQEQSEEDVDMDDLSAYVVETVDGEQSTEFTTAGDGN